MDLHKMKIADIRGLEGSKSRETEQEIRRELVKMRMDIYTAKSAQGAKSRGLRTALARLLTVRAEEAAKQPKQAAKAKAPAAPKAKAEPKAKAVAAPKAEKTPKATKAAPKAETKTKAKPSKK